MTTKVTTDYSATPFIKLQEIHSKLCAEAHGRGVSLAEHLTVDFDTQEQGAAVCRELDGLIGDSETSGVAEAPEEVQSAPTALKSSRKARPAKEKNPAATAAHSEESTMSTTTKAPAKKAAKKAPAKKVAKKTSTKTAAKKAATKTARKPREGNKTADVIALMKRAKGVTRDEVLKLTGWKAVSMQQLAKSAGVKMKIEGERPFHYKVA